MLNRRSVIAGAAALTALPVLPADATPVRLTVREIETFFSNVSGSVVDGQIAAGVPVDFSIAWMKDLKALPKSAHPLSPHVLVEGSMAGFSEHFREIGPRTNILRIVDLGRRPDGKLVLTFVTDTRDV
jgi:hypothetical protein